VQRRQESSTSTSKTCSSCCNHPYIQDTATTTQDSRNVKTVAQAIKLATDLRIKDCASLLPCVRRIAPTKRTMTDTRHFHTESLCFLKDLLFFQVNDNVDNDVESVEMKNWREHIMRETRNKQRKDDGSLDTKSLYDCDTLEPALHCWHTVRLPPADRLESIHAEI
jgi:hypothetical protein